VGSSEGHLSCCLAHLETISGSWLLPLNGNGLRESAALTPNRTISQATDSSELHHLPSSPIPASTPLLLGWMDGAAAMCSMGSWPLWFCPFRQSDQWTGGFYLSQLHMTSECCFGRQSQEKPVTT